MGYRLHIVGLPHTQTTASHPTCAYTQKIVKLCRMLDDQYEIILYSGDENEAPCAEHVVTVTSEEQRSWFGAHDEGDLERGGFDWDPSSPWWQTMNGRAISAIGERVDSQDLILLIAGWAQKPIMDAHPGVTACEWGVGYRGICTNFRAFESSAWMHHVYGLQGVENGVWYDEVIPNFFDPAEFPHRNDGDGGYLLYVGRIIERKGVHVALQIAEQLGRELVVAGPATGHGEGWVQAERFRLESPLLRYVGPVGIGERARLMAEASCLLAPTLYLEPFGGVAVEAMMCGTPAVTTDWGAFRETVEEGVSGYRFRTLAEGCQAVLAAEGLEPATVRAYASGRYSLASVAPRYRRWFDRLNGLWEDGWSAPYTSTLEV